MRWPTFLRSFLLLAHLDLAGAALVMLNDDNSRLSWTPPNEAAASKCEGKPENDECTGVWWVEDADAGGEHFTWGPNTTMSFAFKGSQFTIFGVQFQYGAQATVLVDGHEVGRIDSGERRDEVKQRLLFHQADLDPKAEHKVLVAYDPIFFNTENRKYLGIDFVLIDEGEDDVGSPTSGSSPSASLASSSSTTSLGPSSSITSLRQGSGPSGTTVNGLIVAAAVLGALTLVFIGLVIALLRRRNQRRSNASQGQPYMHVVPATFPSAITSVGPSDASPVEARAGRTAESSHLEFFARSSVPPTQGTVLSLGPPAYTKRR